MADNPLKGPGRRGAVRQHSQVFNSLIGRYVKRDSGSGRFIDVKADYKKFKGVRVEHPSNRRVSS